MTSRNWVITINNPWTVPIDIGDLESQHVKMFIYQLEEVSTPHLQGYIEFNQPVRLAAVKNIFPTCHAEKRKGSRKQAVHYVTKQETRKEGPWLIHKDGITLETFLQQINGEKNRSGLQLIKEKLDAGSSEKEIADEYFNDWVRHYKAFREYKLLKTQPRSTFEKLIVIIGPSGTGKSKFAMEQYPNAYWKQRSQWWDGYEGQDTVILDEFYGWLSFDVLLRLCDRYPLLLERKGGQVQCLATTVVITSNLVPQDWYQKGYKPALYRRISNILYMPHLGETIHFNTVESFINSNISIPKE